MSDLIIEQVLMKEEFIKYGKRRLEWMFQELCEKAIKQCNGYNVFLPVVEFKKAKQLSNNFAIANSIYITMYLFVTDVNIATIAMIDAHIKRCKEKNWYLLSEIMKEEVEWPLSSLKIMEQ